MEGRSNNENSVYTITFPTRLSFNIGIQQKTHLQEIFKPTSRKPAAISRKTEQQQYQEGTVSPQHIKMDSQFRIRRSNMVRDNKRTRIVGDSTEGSKNVV